MEKIEWSKLIEEALTIEGSLGNTYNRFYNYSFLNQVLLMMQGVREPVATYKTWQSIGRQVLRGSHAKEIVRPIVVQKKDAQGEVEFTARRFKIVKCIFALSDTEGADMPEVQFPDWDLDTALKALSIERVPFDMLDGNVQGYALDRRLAINPVAVHPAKTRMHEIGHIVLGHTSGENIHEYLAHRGMKEFQAEATAYLAMNELGQLEPEAASVSRAYVQHWLQDERPGDTAIRQVFSAVNTILTAGRAPMEGAA